MLKLQDLCFKINDNEYILKDLNLNFEKGKITVITGQNGSGKTTLTKNIMGITFPTSGKIIFNGEDVTNLPLNERAKKGMTYAFQQPVRFKGIKVKDILQLASGKDSNINQACEYLSKVGLCARDYIDRELDSSLSGGELKRIELAVSLSKGGELFLFDEPEAGIDLWSFENLIEIFRNLENKTIIIVSHQKKILDIADNIVLLNKNNQVFHGKREEIMPLIDNNKCSILEAKNG